MVEAGYLVQERSLYDRRSIHVKLTGKGRALRDRLSAMHERHMTLLKQTDITSAGLETAAMTLRRPERFWMHGSDAAWASPPFAA